MTIIVAVKDKKNKKIVLGADKLGCRSYLKTDNENKILKLNVNFVDAYNNNKGSKPLFIGISGLSFLHSYLEYGFNVPDMDVTDNFVSYLYNDFLPALREGLTDDNLVEVNSNLLDSECSMLLVFDGEMYLVHSNFHVNYVYDDFTVIGSGDEVAVGSIYTNLNFHKDVSVEDVVTQAIKCCGNTNIYCNDDVTLEIINY